MKHVNLVEKEEVMGRGWVLTVFEILDLWIEEGLYVYTIEGSVYKDQDTELAHAETVIKTGNIDISLHVSAFRREENANVFKLMVSLDILDAELVRTLNRVKTFNVNKINGKVDYDAIVNFIREYVEYTHTARSNRAKTLRARNNCDKVITNLLEAEAPTEQILNELGVCTFITADKITPGEEQFRISIRGISADDIQSVYPEIVRLLSNKIH